MDLIKAQLARIQQQLAGLSSSQKMLAGALVVIMVMTLLYWSKYAGEAQMTPLLEQSFASDEVARISQRLDARGIAFKVVGDKVLVPADRKYEVLADLSYQQLMPSDTKSGFDEMVSKMSPWASPSEQKERFNRAREITAAQIIGRFPAVASAQVVIDPNSERRISMVSQPSATVYISMRSGQKPDKKLVYAAADVVTGVQAALPRDRVAVVVDGISYPVHGRDEDHLAMSDDFVQKMQQWERHWVENIQQQLSFIPSGVLASVKVELQTVSQQSTKTEVDPKKFLHKPIEEETTTEQSSNVAQGGEPGVAGNTGAANQGISLEAAGGEHTSTTNERTKSRFQLEASKETIQSKMPAGNGTVVSATVRVPRSYFANIYKKSYPTQTQEPEEALLKPLIDLELPKIRDDVMMCTGLKDATAVKVDTYVDLMPQLEMAPRVVAASGISLAVGSYAKEIALGALAVMSLFMVMLMVRRATPAPVAPRRAELPPPQQLIAGEGLAGEAAEGDPMLDGMELDEDAIKTQQMLHQVETLVTENPDAAANLVKRWLNRT